MLATLEREKNCLLSPRERTIAPLEPDLLNPQQQAFSYRFGVRRPVNEKEVWNVGSRFGSQMRAVIAVLMIVAAFAALPMAGLATAAPRTVTVATRNLAPFVITNDSGKSGFTIELWEEIAKRQGWTTEYVDAENVTAQLKDVADRRAEVGAGAISITAERRHTFDFSQPIFNGGLQILVPHRASVPSQPGLVNFLPLLFSKAMGVWLLAGLILSVIPAHLFWLIERRKAEGPKVAGGDDDDGADDGGDDEEEEEGISRSYFPGIFQAFAWSVGFLGFMPDTFPHRSLGRLLGILWGFIAIIFVSYFTATLTTNLTVSTYEGQITGPSDLVGKKVATVAGTTSARHLQDIGVPATGLPNIDDCLLGLRDGTYEAVVFDSPVLRYYAAGDGNGAVQLAGPVFNPEDYGLAFAQNSDLRPQVDQALLEIRQDGTYDLIKRKWFGAETTESGDQPG
ncbi:MAG: transporter substrate-binding domain-containing protein [Mycobacterium sp.]|nr:transporter substrate-binding domain-containing protein [Mycobacterium sp.]